MINLSRRNGESELDFHKRLIYGKLVDKTLSDADYSEVAECVYGQKYNSDVARRMLYGSAKTLRVVDKENKEGISDKEAIAIIDEKELELRKERQRLFDQRTAFNKLVRERARQEELNDVVKNAIENSELPELRSKEMNESFVCLDNDLLVSMNDIHYGANIHNQWNTYNSDILKKNVEKYIDEIISIARTHMSANCIVWANGDLISGSTHVPIAIQNKENVVEQIIGVSELLSQFLAKLSPYFETVRFVSVAGNHSRLDKKDDSLKDERLDNLVEWYMDARLQNVENVSIGADKKLDTTMYAMNVRGKTYVGVHGDFDGSREKVMTLQVMAGGDAYAVLSGHLHHNKIDTVQGIKTIMAGSFLGMDDYCIEKRIFGKPEQMVCVCDESGIVCSYDIYF